MKSDAEIQERANALAKHGVAAVDVLDAPLPTSLRMRIEREIAIAFTVGYAAGAEDQAGVIRNRPVSQRGTRG